MIAQQKILRVFKLITTLKSANGKSVKNIARTIDATERTVYRYFELLEELGFQVIKTEFGLYKLLDSESAPMEYLRFTEEETRQLSEMIQSMGSKSALKDSLLRKINIKSENTQLASNLFKAHLSVIVSRLSDAIRLEQQVVLKDYLSLNSQQVSDRLVEPVGFSENYDKVHAFEVASGTTKVFKIERIGDVEITPHLWKFQKLHEVPENSLFGFSGKSRFKVKLQLSLTAYTLLKEEHPNAMPFTKKDEKQNYYYLEAALPELTGIARFILGLMDEIKVIEGDELISLLRFKLLEAQSKLPLGG
ncbi:helix-turn-helix transcriptional regulator [Penaeicola halotolerans]|uniref:helix-turn-helix transcriptional regulator n=1 Tax=Penaeicola halotolerans TaxID=2793196 RepID=UPI001CF8039D|nr:WYL domain-containing protein [Penaeicola halotolerans]